MSNFNKILKYRKFLIKQLKYTKLNSKYILLCDFNYFNGLGLKLLKYFLIKNNFKFNVNKKLLSNFFLNIKYINTNLIYFKFNKFNNIIKFIKILNKLTLIPFFFFPLLILNPSKNIIFPINKLNFEKLKCINRNFFIKLIFINFIKKLISNYIIKLLIKIKKCQL